MKHYSDEQEQITIQNFRTEKHGPLQWYYKDLQKITKGNYGNVYRCFHKATKTKRCLKVYSKKLLKKSSQMHFKTEIEILKDMDHPNIYKIYEFFEDDENYYLISEYMEGGELFDFMMDHTKVPEFIAFTIIEQLLSAINYLHNHNIIHRDIKPENVMLLNKNDPSLIKLIDFGTCKRFEKNQKFTTPVGSCYYMAPEQIMGEYDHRVDIWACGIILYVLLVGYPPFNGHKDNNVLSRIVKQPLVFDDSDWRSISCEAKDLITKMLEKNPDDRITLKNIFKHKWFENNMNNKIGDKAKTILNRFLTINNNSQLEKVLRTYLIQCFDLKSEMTEITKLFRVMDLDHDGSISKEELKSACNKLTIDIDENQILKFVDVNNDNQVNYSEFLGALIDFSQATNKEMLKDIFTSIDTDKNGYITRDELIKFLNVGIDSHVVEQLFEEVDKNKDEKITFEEFMETLEHF